MPRRAVPRRAEPVYDLDLYSGRPFGAVFVRKRADPPGRWRVRGSGVSGFPTHAPTTAAVLAALEAVGVPADVDGSFSPGGCDSFEVVGRFLDGVAEVRTGPYMGSPKGVHVGGPWAVLLVALTLGLRCCRAGCKRTGWSALPRPAIHRSGCRCRDRGPGGCSARSPSRRRAGPVRRR